MRCPETGLIVKLVVFENYHMLQRSDGLYFDADWELELSWCKFEWVSRLACWSLRSCLQAFAEYKRQLCRKDHWLVEGF